jgi:hypothetical protein
MAVGAVVARILTQYSDKGSKAARKDINKLGKDFDAFAKRSAQAFGLAAAATAAFAVKVGTDAVQAAIEDQKSQTILANSLRNTIGATDDAIAATERYIAKQQLLVGVSDTQLRQSLITLTGATRDLTEAQSLQNVALDVAASGYGDVESVSKALAKAYTGNLGALKKLVPGLDANIVKTKDFNAAMIYLSDTFSGAAAASADTLEGRLRILRLSYDEILETLGYALLPVVQEFAGYLVSNVLPKIQEWVDLNKDKLAVGLRSVASTLKTVVEKALALGQWITDNTNKVKAFGLVLGGLFAVSSAAKFVLMIQSVIAAMTLLRTTAIGAAIATAFATGGVSLATAATGLAAIGVTALVTKNFMKSMTGETEKTTKATGKLNSAHASSLKLNKEFNVTSGKYNTSLNTTVNTTKKLTAEQLKALEVQKQLAKYGVVTQNENDPIQLEAARLNLLKQQALAIESTGNEMFKLLELQFKNNTEAQRYADILAVINDNKISTIELDALASKWGKSTSFVLNYIKEVTGVNSIVLDKDFGLDASKGWEKARKELEKYLIELGAAGTVSPEVQAVVNETDAATAAAEAAAAAAEAAVAEAEAAARATEEYLRSIGMGTGQDNWAESQPWWREGGFGASTTSAASFAPTIDNAGSLATAGSKNSTINVTVNAGSVIGSQSELVSTVREGILAGQGSGNKILLNPLDL